MTMWFFFNAWHAHGLTSFTVYVLSISIFMLSFLIGVPFSLACDYPWARLGRVLIGTKVDEDMPHYDLQDQLIDDDLKSSRASMDEGHTRIN